MYERPKTIETMNEKVKAIMDDIEDENYLNALDDIDEQIKNHVFAKDKEFYSKKQDEINLIYNKLRAYYYELSAALETYVACRTFALMAEYELNKDKKKITVAGKPTVLSRVPGRDLLRDACISEIPDLHYAMIFLKGQKNRADSALKTARNHTYGEDTNDTKDDAKDEKGDE